MTVEITIELGVETMQEEEGNGKYENKFNFWVK